MKNSSKQNIPDIFVTIGYKDIYDDYDNVDIHSLLADIPTVSLLNFVIERNNRVIYSPGSGDKQRQMLHETCKYLDRDTKKKVRKFMDRQLRSNYQINYIDNTGCILFMGLALQNFTPYAPDDSELLICQDEYEAVFKAIIYCNQRWIDEQQKGIRAVSNPSWEDEDIYMLIDLPIVEFKQYKDFIVQFYKAWCFFDFCEQSPKYLEDLKTFCAQRAVSHWKGYLLKLFGFLEASIKNIENPYIKLPKGTLGDLSSFFDQYIINIEDCGNLWEGHNALQYFRDHFLLKVSPDTLKVSPDTYLLINANFLVDKFYQGMRFDFFKALKATSSKYKNYPDFSTRLSQDFSESNLFWRLIKQIYNENQDALILTGEDFRQQRITAEPDLYLRIGNRLFLFEYKDVTLGDSIKYSHTIRRIKEGICDRICRYDKKKKGAGQLLYNIDRIFTKDLVRDIDPDIDLASKVYPIIVTTDRSFSAIGVNRFVIQEFSKWMKSPLSIPCLVTVPIIMGLDTLILCADMLHEGVLTLHDLLDGYIQTNKLASLDVYVKDTHLKGKVWSKSDLEFLFGDFFEDEAIEDV